MLDFTLLGADPPHPLTPSLRRGQKLPCTSESTWLVEYSWLRSAVVNNAGPVVNWLHVEVVIRRASGSCHSLVATRDGGEGFGADLIYSRQPFIFAGRMSEDVRVTYLLNPLDNLLLW